MVLELEFGAKVYDYLGDHYAIYRVIRWISCLGREAALQRRAIHALGLRPANTVLDLACGTGVNFADLQEAVGPQGKIIALDYSQGMLGRAKERASQAGWQNIEFVQGDAERMDLGENTLDVALCTFGLSAMPGEAAAIENVARALKPGGRFVVFDAKPFTGIGRALNPIVCPFFKYSTNWNYRKDVIGILKRNFPKVDVMEFNSGCNYLAVAVKTDDLRVVELTDTGGTSIN